jgi:AcrR family transcriptional regulator
MSRKEELSRQAARLFAEKGYHGTSIGDLADSMGV